MIFVYPVQLRLELLLIHVLHVELQRLHTEQGSSLQSFFIASIKYPSLHTHFPTLEFKLGIKAACS